MPGLGIDLGGSSVKGVAVTPEGKLLGQANVAFDPESPMHWAETIQEVLAQLRESTGEPARGIGLSAPGLASRDGRSIAHMPGRLHGLEGLDWSEHLGVSFPVPVLNDAHAALLGESWLGAARGFSNVILLTLGTGVGGAAIIDGRLLQGHTGKAGHLGHVCLDTHGTPDVCGVPGSLEIKIGNCSIRDRSQGRFTTTHDLVKAHLNHDAEATRIWMESVRDLACAIGSFTNILDPEAVIIGGGIARAGQALFEPLQAMVPDLEWKVCRHQVKILPAQLGELAGAYGAAWQGLQHRS